MNPLTCTLSEYDHDNFDATWACHCCKIRFTIGIYARGECLTTFRMSSDSRCGRVKHCCWEIVGRCGENALIEQSECQEEEKFEGRRLRCGFILRPLTNSGSHRLHDSGMDENSDDPCGHEIVYDPFWCCTLYNDHSR